MAHRHHWQDYVFGVIGLWLIISPWIFGMVGAGAWSMVVLGALVVVLAAIGLMRAEMQDWTDYAVAVAAILVVAAPWLVGFTGMEVAVWNAVLCGIVLVIAALWSHLMPHEGGHA